jgi:hypothetical protein
MVGVAEVKQCKLGIVLKISLTADSWSALWIGRRTVRFAAHNAKAVALGFTFMGEKGR